MVFLLQKMEKVLVLILLGSVCFLGGYCAKRQTETTKTEVKKEQVLVEKEVVRYIVRQVNKPDGTTITETIAEKENKQENKVVTEKKEEKKVVAYDRKKWQLNYLGAYQTNGGLAHGLQLNRRIGNSPFTIGVWGVQNIGVGISIGMEF